MIIRVGGLVTLVVVVVVVVVFVVAVFDWAYFDCTKFYMWCLLRI